jgi:hypothetical protein
LRSPHSAGRCNCSKPMISAGEWPVARAHETTTEAAATRDD